MNVYVSQYCPICHRAIAEGNEDESLPNILAKRIITDPERRFITDDQLHQLELINQSYMNITIYDSDKNGVVDLAERALKAESVEWDKIEGRPPNLTIAAVDELIANMHKHDNKVALDNITIDTNRNLPLWGGVDWPTNTTAKQMPLASKSIRNTYIMPDMPSDSTLGDVWIENERNRDTMKAIHVNKGSNHWITLSVNEVSDIVKDKVLDAINNSGGGGGGGGGGAGSIQTYTRTFSGNNVDTEYTITHNLKSTKVLAQLIDMNSNEDVQVCFTRNNDNMVKVSFNRPPKPTDTYLLMLVKCQ